MADGKHVRRDELVGISPGARRTRDMLAAMSWSRHLGIWLWIGLSAARSSAQAGVDDVDGGVPEDAGAAISDTTPASELRGLLAAEPFDKQPMKALYFFPGEAGAFNRELYTSHPALAADSHWNSDPSTRAGVADRMIAANVNTVVMSYWGDEMPQWSPMELDATSVVGVLEAVSGKPLRVIPALESGFDANRPSVPHWRFCEDFPYAGGHYAQEALAPSFLARLRSMIELFRDRRGAWAQMYDREGLPRYVVHVMHAYALHVPQVEGRTADQVVAEAFDAVAARLKDSDGIDIGFTLDLSAGEPGTYAFQPASAGLALVRAKSVLAVQLFVSEAHSGHVRSGAPWDPPFDNNESNLEALIDAKTRTLSLWRIAGLPVVYDVTPGFDGRFVWAELGTGFWGDNYAYTSDDWRNLQSESRDPDFIGMSFNTWNGYTEGYAAVPTVEHGTTIYTWLSDVYRDDPRECHHVEYEDGRAAYRIDGAICEKWRSLRGRRGVLGEPISDVLEAERATFAHFADGSVFVSAAQGVHEVHGPIHAEYRRLGYDTSCLGLPIADPEAVADGVRSRFEQGAITLAYGASTATAQCEVAGMTAAPN